MAKLKDGFYKLTASSMGSNLHVLLAGGGAKPISDFASSFDVKLWGNTFDGSQDVNGWISLPNTVGIYGTDTEGNKNHILLYSDSNVVNVGGGAAVRGHDTRIFGNNIYLAYSSNRTDGLTLKSDGQITIAKSIFSGNSAFGQGRLELSGGTPFIDFHFNESAADYTSRIIENSSGELTCEKAWKVGGATTLLSTLSVQGTGTFNSQIISNVADGTAPLVVTSTTKVSNLNADLLDGLHGSWYLKNAISFKLTKGVAENQGYDVNTLTEGMVYNYESAGYWKNGPSGMSYGLVLNLKNGSSNSLSGQLAWDVSHNNTTDTTRSLWWRASDNGTFTNAQWHKIAFLESIPNVTDYYWANIPISPESNDATTPKVLYLYATNGINTSYIRSSSSMSISSTYSITLSANDSSVIKIADTFINPLKDDTVNLGTPYNRWSDIYTKSLTTESLNYRCKGSNEYPTMYFFNDTWTYLGFFGINSEKKFVIGDQSGYSSNYVLHSGNSSVSGGGSSWGSSITVKINGTSKTLTIPANPNTDLNVYQGETTTSSYRPLIFGYNSSSTAGSGMATAVTNVVYASNKFYALPSTGNLYATLFNGILNTTSNLYYADSKYGILMNNSDIIGVNAIYFGDSVDSAGEGINFYRSSTTWDTLAAAGGILYFSANRATATHTLTPVFSALSNSGNNISITIGGLNRTLTPAYASSAGSADSSNYILSHDTRNDTIKPNTYNNGFRCHFLANGTNGVNDGGNYYGLLHIKHYGSKDDHTGGYPHQIAFTPNNNLWHRIGTSATGWGSWIKILDSNNYTTVLDSRYVNASGDTMTGPLTFANGTWNVVGDDAAIGDYNAAGMLGLKSINNNIPGIGFHNSSNTLLGRLQASGSDLLWNDNKIWHAGNDGSGSGLDADTVDGIHANSLPQIKYIGNTGDFCYDVILLCKRDEVHQKRLDGILFTTGGGVCRYHCADVHFWHSCWSVGSYDVYNSMTNKSHNDYNFEFCTCTYGGAVWYAIRLCRVQAVSYYFMGNQDGINFSLITYYNTNSGVKNSEIYNSISLMTSNNMRYAGNIYANHFYESSDIALKDNIKSIIDSDNIPQLKSFDWKSDGSHSYGLIALELEEMGYPELVSNSGSYKTVNYSAALSLIVGKLQVKIKELEKEIEILKNKN